MSQGPCDQIIDALDAMTIRAEKAEAQVAALRSMLAWFEHQPKANDPWYACGKCGGIFHFDGCELVAILADTAASAAAHDERIRAEERERCIKAATVAIYRWQDDGRPKLVPIDNVAAAIRALSPSKP